MTDSLNSAEVGKKWEYHFYFTESFSGISSCLVFTSALQQLEYVDRSFLSFAVPAFSSIFVFLLKKSTMRKCIRSKLADVSVTSQSKTRDL